MVNVIFSQFFKPAFISFTLLLSMKFSTVVYYYKSVFFHGVSRSLDVLLNVIFKKCFFLNLSLLTIQFEPMKLIQKRRKRECSSCVGGFISMVSLHQNMSVIHQKETKIHLRNITIDPITWKRYEAHELFGIVTLYDPSHCNHLDEEFSRQ